MPTWSPVHVSSWSCWLSFKDVLFYPAWHCLCFIIWNISYKNCNNSKNRDNWISSLIVIKMKQNGFKLREADGPANSVNPDQMAPLGAIWSGSALFALSYLTQYFEFHGMWLLLFVRKFTLARENLYISCASMRRNKSVCRST